MSTTFKTPVTAALPYDPFKQVNYTLGMVWGLDDAKLAAFYPVQRVQLAMRELVIYGTTTGLAVHIDDKDQDFQVVVGAGMAITPRGQFVRVESVRCARLEAWLAAHRNEVVAHTSAPPTDVIRLYVVLYYRECPVDPKPIPGEPCRSEDDAMRPSRLQDDHLLELRWEPPDQRQFDSQQDFLAWVRQIPLDDVLVDNPINRQAFIDAIRKAVPQLHTPPDAAPLSPPYYMVGAPPAALRIPRAALCEYLDIAFRLWVTELRPLWLGKNQAVAGGTPDEECVLLAQIDVPLIDDGKRVDPARSIIINEDHRPYIPSMQMMYEWMTCGLTHFLTPPDLVGDVQGRPSDNEIVQLRGVDVLTDGLTAPNDNGKVLTYQDNHWIASPVTVPDTSIEMRVDNGIVQWKHTSDATWIDLFHLSDLPGGAGTPGASVEMRVDSGFIQWQHTGDATWTNLITLNDLTGPQGPSGVTPIVAAGRFDNQGKVLFTLGNLAAHPILLTDPANLAQTALLFLLTFDAFKSENSYIVKGTIVNSMFGTPRFIEVIDLSEERPELKDALHDAILAYNAATGNQVEQDMYIIVRVAPFIDEKPRGLMIEISGVTR